MPIKEILPAVKGKEAAKQLEELVSAMIKNVAANEKEAMLIVHVSDEDFTVLPVNMSPVVLRACLMYFLGLMDEVDEALATKRVLN